MEKKQYDLCIEVLRRLNNQNLLESVILIGSWCMPFYKEYFSGINYLSSFKTRDLDFLVPHPNKLMMNIDIADLLKDLGFVVGFTGSKGYMKLEHPDLVIEFLSPEKGKGTDKPIPLPQLKINAQALRFLGFLAEDTIKIKIEDFYVVMPHPANFALHKLIISQRRQNKDKAEKDKIMALEILNALVTKGATNKIGEVFELVSPKWQKKITGALDRIKDRRVLEVLRTPGP